MPLVRRRIVPLAFKHMPQMAPAIRAHDLRPLHPKRRIRVPRHRPRDAVKVRRPPASGLELVRRLVQRRLASRAPVHARRGGVLVVFARERRFRALLAQDPELLRREDGAPFGVGARVGVAGG